MTKSLSVTLLSYMYGKMALCPLRTPEPDAAKFQRWASSLSSQEGPEDDCESQWNREGRE